MEPKKLRTQATDFIKNIGANKKEAEVEENLLGIAPDFDKSLLEDAAPKKSIALIFLKSFFVLLVLGSLASALFFNFQMTDRFEFVSAKTGLESLYKKVISTNGQLVELKTDQNFYRLLTAKGHLDEFSFNSDLFLRDYAIANSQTASNAEVENAKAEMAKLREEIEKSFAEAREKVLQKSYVDLASIKSDPTSTVNRFDTELTQRFNSKAKELAESEDLKAQREAQNYFYAGRLASNSKLRSLMNETDIAALDVDGFAKFVREMNSVILNELTLISTIKHDRILWSDIIDEIDIRTKTVDQYYSQNFYDDFGGIRYNSYDFDSTNHRITLIGETKRLDTTNFTVISNLIDELNRSEMFENAEMRSFTKSGSLTEGYTATLKLSLDLVTE